MPRKTRKQMSKVKPGKGRGAGYDGRSGASTTPTRRRSGGLIPKRVGH